jgi:subtilisin family serine protease
LSSYSSSMLIIAHASFPDHPSFLYFSSVAAGAACGTKYGVSAGCQLCSIKVVDKNANLAPVQNWINGVNFIKDYCMASKSLCVVNIDWWPKVNSDALNAAIVAAIDAGVVMVIYAGVGNVDTCKTDYAQPIKEAITVGITGENDKLAADSNYGACVDVYAPGDKIKGPGLNSATDSYDKDWGISCKFIDVADA